MEDINKQAELYAESFRYKVDNGSWYEQKKRDFISGYEAALRIHAVSSSVCPCNELSNGEIAISSKALQKPYGDLGQTDC